MKTFKILSSTTLKFIINYCCVPQSSKCARAASYEGQRCLPVSLSALFFDTLSLNPKLPHWLDWLEQQTLMIFLPPSPSSWIIGYSTNSTILIGCWGSKLKTLGRYRKHPMHGHSDLILELLVPL